jgi:HAMP domain-containing protein
MRFLSLRWKIAGILVLSNVLLGSIITIVVHNQVTSILEKEVIERGKSIGENISHYSSTQMIEEDREGLRLIISDMQAFELMEYLIIYDNDFSVLADNFNQQIPEVLLNRPANFEDGINRPQIINLYDKKVECYDIFVAVDEGSVGYIRLGMKKAYIDQKVNATNQFILITIAVLTLLGIIIVYFVANRIIRPIIYLTTRANEISKGKLEEQVTAKTGDEIHYLAESIERLRESLKMALERLKKHQTLRI